MPLLSIVLTTYRRPQILAQALEHLRKQTIAQDLEVIVVSDGPDPATEKTVQDAATRYPLPAIRYVEIPKSHQGVARNRGVEKATAPLVLFSQDDIFLAPDACERHVFTHQKQTSSGASLPAPRYPLLAVLGYSTWDPRMEITPVMRWLEESGWQFGYPKIAAFAHDFLPKEIQANFTYTSHISLPTEVTRRFPFREDVSLYGWEDIEWGMRLRDAGVRLFYEPDATALHHHALTLEDSLRRMETLGMSLVTMAKATPEFQGKLAPWRLFLQHMLALLPTMSGRHRRALLRGIHRCDKSA